MIVNFEGVGCRYRGLIKSVIEEGVKQTKNTFDNAIVTITFVKPKRIKELNKEYRQVDKETDVLSFPMLDIVYPQKLKDFKQEVAPDGSLYLGDVVICTKVAKRQAKEYAHSKKREVAFLALHGFLHLLGYDHIEKDDEKIMMAESKKILEALNIKRKDNV